MPERLEKLKATINDLEEELESLDSIDDEARRLLEEAVGEMQAAIRKQDPTHMESESISEKLSDTAERFETSHPTLFGIVSRIVDALGQMGI